MLLTGKLRHKRRSFLPEALRMLDQIGFNDLAKRVDNHFVRYGVTDRHGSADSSQRSDDFKLEIWPKSFTISFMRYLALLSAIVLLAGCQSSDDAYVPGRIPKETAIAIASRANKQYPYPLSKITRASWRPQQGYWAIDFKDP